MKTSGFVSFNRFCHARTLALRLVPLAAALPLMAGGCESSLPTSSGTVVPGGRLITYTDEMLAAEGVTLGSREPAAPRTVLVQSTPAEPVAAKPERKPEPASAPVPARVVETPDPAPVTQIASVPESAPAPAPAQAPAQAPAPIQATPSARPASQPSGVVITSARNIEAQIAGVPPQAPAAASASTPASANAAAPATPPNTILSEGVTPASSPTGSGNRPATVIARVDGLPRERYWLTSAGTGAVTQLRVMQADGGTLLSSVEIPDAARSGPGTLSASRDGRLAAILAGADVIIPLSMDKLAAPTTMQPVRIGAPLGGIDVHPAGEFIAASAAAPGKQIVIIDRLAMQGQEGPLTWPLLGLDTETALGAVRWHPTGRYLAILLPTRREVALYEITRPGKDGTPGLAPWGSPLRLPAAPIDLQFTPDGRHLIVLCAGASAISTDGVATAGTGGAGLLTAVRLSTVPTSIRRNGQPSPIPVEHAVISQQPVGVAPSALAINADGSQIIVASGADTASPRGAVFVAGFNRESSMLAAPARVSMTHVPTTVSLYRDGTAALVQTSAGAMMIDLTATPQPKVTGAVENSSDWRGTLIR